MTWRKYLRPFPPRFDGDEYKIGTFLASFENRARMAGIEEARWKKHIVDYVDRDTRNQWMQLEEFSGDTRWPEFKEQVLKAYPENRTIKEYSLEELKEKIDKWKGHSLCSLEDVTAVPNLVGTGWKHTHNQRQDC